MDFQGKYNWYLNTIIATKKSKYCCISTSRVFHNAKRDFKRTGRIKHFSMVAEDNFESDLREAFVKEMCREEWVEWKNARKVVSNSI